MDDALYLLDAGVGLAFAHVNKLPMLKRHYGERIMYLAEVYEEWESQARSCPVDRPRDPDFFARACRKKMAAKRLVSTVERELGERFYLPLEAASELDDLVEAYFAWLGKPRDDTNIGECACMLKGVHELAQGRRVVVLTANDGPARRFAGTQGLSSRNMHTVLREMVANPDMGLSAADAWELYLRMDTVTQLPAGERPSGPHDFS